MEIVILGAHNCESLNTRLVSLLIDQTIAIDAGGLTSSLSISAQQQIKAILITHHHFDHIRDLATFGMNAYMWGPINVYALDSVLGVISTHLLNDVLYPDFQQKPLPEKPSLKFCPLEPNKEAIIEGYRVLPLPVHHNVPTVGYWITSPDKKSLFYTGDTGSGCSSCWEVVLPELLITEVSVPNSLEMMAQASGHLSPRLLKEELLDFKRIRGYLPPIVTVHMSPHFEGEIREEVAQVAKELEAKITLGYEGMRIVL
ncbi:MAG: MBL fold metallo-hydrolase [Dehalococcoidia bacterium]|nr:MBL fold metallo-hydrolase [Dehalococcoidia bacterium]